MERQRARRELTLDLEPDFLSADVVVSMDTGDQQPSQEDARAPRSRPADRRSSIEASTSPVIARNLRARVVKFTSVFLSGNMWT
jgi:hypothetical protein